MAEPVLETSGLSRLFGGLAAVQDVALSVLPGEVHAVVGPNGAGKTTLINLLSGDLRPSSGTVRYQGQDLLELSPEERAWKGIFLAFQYPVEIPGVSNMNFLRTALNESKKARGEAELSGKDFLVLVRERAKLVEMDPDLMSRNLNVGFSGGEKKRNEIFQMAMLEPKLGILDETDSGLDIDALRIVAGGVNKLRSTDNAFIVVTHYQRLLDYIVPDFVHVMADGRIIKSGPKELALELEAKGYDWIKEETV